MSPSFPDIVERHLREVLIDQAHPLVLTVNGAWNLQACCGDSAFWGFVEGQRDEALETVRDLFLDADTDVGQGFQFVELPQGQAAHLHLVKDGALMHVVLLDARGDSERQRVSQQLGDEAEFAGVDKTRAISRLQQIRSELERQRERLEEANALKSAFMATLSHEFRTPLTSIFGYLHLLERRLAGDAATQHSLRAIRRGATHLLGLSENLLEYGRGESGRAQLNPIRVEPEQLAEDLRVMFAPLAREEGLDLTVESETVPVPLIHDEVRVRQIMINLISNAIRYTPRGSVQASVRWNGSALVLRVADSGIGIPAELRSAIFKPFNAGGQQGSKGAGLGLSIVRRLVEQMQGSLGLDSVPGEGTRFEIVLPPLGSAQSAAELKQHSGADTKSSSMGGIALVVDDDVDIRALVRTLLRDLGFEVHTAADASEGFEAAMRLRPDIAIIDVQMPGLSGNAAVSRLRANGYQGMIMMLSADDSPEARASSLAAGSDSYLTKPINIERFVRSVRSAVENPG